MSQQKKIRLGLDGRPLSTGVTGVGRYIAEMVRAMAGLNKYKFFIFSQKPIHESHKDILKIPDVDFCQGKGILARKGGLYFNLQLPIILRKMDLDIFWGSQQVLPPFLPDIPAILTFYDMVSYFYPDTMRFTARMQQKFFQGYSVRRASHISSISNGTDVDMRRYFNYPETKTSVAYPGINPQAIEASLKKVRSSRVSEVMKIPYILSVSTIEPRKNYPFLLKVISQLTATYPDFNFRWVIAGRRGWETPEFYEQLKQFERETGKVIFFEEPDDGELQHLYKNASLFIFASRYEGFGIPLTEALYHGINSIASDIPTFREVGKDKMEYFPEENLNAWVRAIREGFGKKIDIPLEEFDWVRSAKILDAAIMKVLNDWKK